MLTRPSRMLRAGHIRRLREMLRREIFYIYLPVCRPIPSPVAARIAHDRAGGAGGWGVFLARRKWTGGKKISRPASLGRRRGGGRETTSTRAFIFGGRRRTRDDGRTDGDGPELASGVRPSRRHRLQWAVLRLPGALGGTATRATARRAARNRVTA